MRLPPPSTHPTGPAPSAAVPRAAACAAALTLLLTACTAGPEEPPVREPAAEQGAAAQAVALEEPEDPYALTDPALTERLYLPLHGYVLDEYEAWTVGRARDVLVVECLNELGFDAAVRTGTTSIEQTLTHFGPYHSYRRYGMASVGLAEEYGFGVPLEDDNEGPYVIADGFDEEAAYDAVSGLSHTGADTATPSGAPVPEGGCGHQANLGISPDSPPPGEDGYWSADEGGLLPDTPGFHALVEDLLGTSYFTAMEDPGVAAAAEGWRACAGLGGYSVDPVGASEVMDDAVLAAECVDSSGYLDAFVAAEAAAQEAMVDEHRDELAQRRDLLRGELETARTVLGW